MKKRRVLAGIMCLSMVLTSSGFTSVWADTVVNPTQHIVDLEKTNETAIVDLTKSAGAVVEFTGTSQEADITDPQVMIKSNVTDQRFATDIVQKGTLNVGKTSGFIVDLGKVTKLTSGTISYIFKAFPIEYTVEVSSDKQSWTNAKTFTKTSSDTSGPVDSYDMPANTQGRYVRFTFNKMNENAAADHVVVKAVTIMGEGETTVPGTDTLAGANASAMMTNFTSITQPTVEDTQVKLPSVPEGYTISVKGSDVENVVSNQGVISQHNIFNREVPIIVQIENNTNKTDRAEKSFTLTVPGKQGKNATIYKPVTNPNEKPGVIPTLQEWYGYEGSYKLTKESRILIADKANIDLQKVAASMKKDLKEFTGYDLEVKVVADKSAATAKDIYLESLSQDSYDLGKEGYYIVNGDNGIEIYAPTYTGALYGTISIEQILWQDKENLQVPKGVIRDYPKYEVRGIMLDIARTPYRYEQLQDYAKMLSWYKISEWHLHLNDNFFDNSGDKTSFEHWNNIEGMFRLQSDTYPSLITDVKKGSQYDYYNNVYKAPHYTKQQWKDLQSLARENGVNIISEIDAPGHSTLFTKYAKANPDNISWLAGGIYRDENWEQLALVGDKGTTANRFITSLMEEYVSGEDPTFSSEVVHIGADEYWSIKDNERPGMKNYIINMHDLLKKYNKKTRMWGHIREYIQSTGMDTSTLNDIQLDVWYLPYEDLDRRLKEGYQVINVDQAILYGNPGRDRRDVVNVEWVFENWDPTVFAGKTLKKGEPALLGGKTALWADINRKGYTENDFHERVLHQAAVIAEKTWGGTQASDTYQDYEFKYGKLKEGPGTHIAMNIDSKTDLVLKYDFANYDATQKKVLDYSGNGYDAAVTGGTTVLKDGVQFLRFDGNTKVESPIRTLGYPYTVSFDVHVDSTDVNNAEASLFSGYDGRLQVAGLEGGFSINRSFFEQKLGYTLPKDKKVSITVVGTAQGTKLYADGKLVSFVCRKTTGDETDYTDLATTFVFPIENIGAGFTGYLGNIKAYKKALSPEVISDLYSNKPITQVNVAQNVPAAGESQALNEGGYDNRDKKLCVGWKAVDGDGKNLLGVYQGVSTEPDSKWLGGSKVDSYLALDLLKTRVLSSVRIQWNAPGFASGFKLQASEDGKAWRDVYTATANTSDLSVITFPTPVTTRYIKLLGTAKNAGNRYSIQEFEAFEIVDKTELRNLLVVPVAEELKEGAINDKGLSKYMQTFIFAESVIENPIATRLEVDMAKTQLRVEGFKASLYQTVAQNSNFEADKYTTESYAALQEALKIANELLESDFVEKSSDEVASAEINKAITGINTAVNNLKNNVQKQGWVSENNKERYYENGTPAANLWIEGEKPGERFYADEEGYKSIGWKKIEGEKYYFDTKGCLVMDWQQIDGSWYYLGADGKLQTGWKNIDQAWYYLGVDGKKATSWTEIDGSRYYLGIDGKKATGWAKVSGLWYYLGTDGKMVTGWKKVGAAWYYMDNSGKMKTGWLKEGSAWYYLQASGKMAIGWQKVGGVWYYLQSSGKMKTGWVKDGGAWYYLLSSGKMATGWVKDGGAWYYLLSSGKMATGWQKVGGAWYYLQSSGKMKTGWLKDGNSWYYLSSGGKMATGWLKIGSAWYYLYSSGKMATGNVVIGGKTYYFNTTSGIWNGK